MIRFEPVHVKTLPISVAVNHPNLLVFVEMGECGPKHAFVYAFERRVQRRALHSHHVM